MARPKTKSALVDGMSELVQSLRNIESKLDQLIKKNKKSSGSGRGPGRPPGKRRKKPGRPPGRKHRGRGRPPGSKNKKK